MIDAVELTKTFGEKVAVSNLSFSVRSGIVTGFLGPNGAGKSTTMRLILGLDRPTSGQARVNGRSYVSVKAPMREVGALLEAKSVHPGRTARSHLRALAATHRIPVRRVDEVIDLVGLATVATKRAGEFSLGMSQRLGLAAALLGDPETLILDEPVNGLDPEGVAWIRSLVKYLAEQGRTVFISSHLMSEMAQTADHVIIIGQGHLIMDSPMSDLLAKYSGVTTRVRSPQVAQIAEAARQSGRVVSDLGEETITIDGWSAPAIGHEASSRGWVLHELTPLQRSLEDVYMQLTEAAVEFQAHERHGPTGEWESLMPNSTRVRSAVATAPPAREDVPSDEFFPPTPGFGLVDPERLRVGPASPRVESAPLPVDTGPLSAYPAPLPVGPGPVPVDPGPLPVDVVPLPVDPARHLVDQTPLPTDLAPLPVDLPAPPAALVPDLVPDAASLPDSPFEHALFDEPVAAQTSPMAGGPMMSARAAEVRAVLDQAIRDCAAQERLDRERARLDRLTLDHRALNPVTVDRVTMEPAPYEPVPVSQVAPAPSGIAPTVHGQAGLGLVTPDNPESAGDQRLLRPRRAWVED